MLKTVIRKDRSCGQCRLKYPYLMKSRLFVIKVRVFMKIKPLPSGFHDREDAIFIVEVIVIIIFVVLPFLWLLQEHRNTSALCLQTSSQNAYLIKVYFILVVVIVVILRQNLPLVLVEILSLKIAIIPRLLRNNYINLHGQILIKFFHPSIIETNASYLFRFR